MRKVFFVEKANNAHISTFSNHFFRRFYAFFIFLMYLAIFF